jgi:hypothetical protein
MALDAREKAVANGNRPFDSPSVSGGRAPRAGTPDQSTDTRASS